MILYNKKRKKYLKDTTANTGHDISCNGASNHITLKFTNSKEEARKYLNYNSAFDTLMDFVHPRTRNNWGII